MIATRVRLSFAAGDLGFNFIWQAIELYLLYFYVRVIGIPPAAASAIFLAGATVDFLIDPLIGSLIDRAGSRVAMRSWVLIGGSAASIALVLVFAEPQLNDARAICYALAAHLFLRVTYSLGNIPYGALTNRISSEPLDQVTLTATRMQGAAIGGLIAASIYAVMPAHGVQGSGFLGGALLLGVLAVPAFLATFYGVRELRPHRTLATVPLRQLFKEYALMVRDSSNLRRALLAIFAAGLSVTVMNKSLLFLFEQMQAMRLGYFLAGVPALSLLFTAPIWLALARRQGAVSALLIAAAVNAAAALAMLFANANLGVTMALVVTALVAGSGMSVMFWALLSQTVEAIEQSFNGVACAARVYALGGIARKLAQALATQVVAVGMMWSTTRSVVPAISVVGILTFGLITAYRPREADRASR